MTAPPNKPFPKDGMVIVSMMKDMGITSYEPRVVNQLMDFAIRYVTCVLEDAKAFASHSKKKAIDNEDVKLAVMMQLDKIFTTPPPRDLLLEVARTRNTTPFPLLLLKNHCGIRLPPDRYCFSNCNYKLKTPIMKPKPDIKKPGLNSPGTIKIDKRPIIRAPMVSTPRAQVTGTAQLRGASVINNPRSYLSNQEQDMKMESQDVLPGTSGNGENKRKREDEL